MRLGIDSHTHLNIISKREDFIKEVLTRTFEEEKLELVVDVALETEDELLKSLKYRALYPDSIIVAFGIHPAEINKENVKNKLDLLEDILFNYGKNISFVGEIGLDYYHNKDKEIQKEALVAIVDIANSFEKPIIVHSRDALYDTYDIFRGNKPLHGGIMHCYSYDYEYAKKFMDLGFYISFAGNITYTKSNELLEAAKGVPVDRILVETDAPFLTPIPYRGKKNFPYYVKHTAKFLSSIRNEDYEAFFKKVSDNLKNLLGL